ncbi:hypothetical protein BC940DRAFT_309590 [Gongronella butleri]|nr:hypothetical protein BC940DRAFT_309590 [Gongronella butleri]
MTELQRNTLFNTIHRHWQEKTASGAPMPLDAKVIQMDLDDDLAEEDYLPNNDDNSMLAPPAHQPRVSVTLENDINDVPSLGYMRTVEEHTIHEDEKEKTKKDTSSENMDATLRVPTGMYSPPTIYLARHKTRRRGSSATIETQGIRFVEPIKPRNLSHTNLSTLSKSPQRHPHEHLQRQEEDENDPAHDTPSLMSWINKHSPLRRAPDLQKDKDASTAHDDDATTRHHSSQGLRHYFFKRAAPASAATPRAQEAQTPQPPSILAPGVLEMQLSPPTVRQPRRSSEHTTKSTITSDHNERQPQL